MGEFQNISAMVVGRKKTMTKEDRFGPACHSWHHVLNVLNQNDNHRGANLVDHVLLIITPVSMPCSHKLPQTKADLASIPAMLEFALFFVLEYLLSCCSISVSSE